ncbi:MAG: hypothetical protein UZ13_03526 [Chloroflexi bacterium OLB13]|nr:MAG: hypothetical protein UZ13_03526 [Chloroflexi bacterium OLB13]
MGGAAMIDALVAVEDRFRRAEQIFAPSRLDIAAHQVAVEQLRGRSPSGLPPSRARSKLSTSLRIA